MRSGARSAGDEQDLAAVLVDVSCEKRDLVPEAGFLRRRDDLVQRSGGGLRAAALQQHVGPFELQERQ